MTEPHYAAVQTRLEAHTGLSGKVFDSARIESDGAYQRTNYVILLGGNPTDIGGDRAVRKQVVGDDATYEFTVEAVGISPSVVRDMLAAARTQLLDWVPNVDGRKVYKPRRYAGDQPSPVVDVKPPLFTARDQYTFRSLFTH